MPQDSTNVFTPISTSSAYNLFPSGTGAPIFSRPLHLPQQHTSPNDTFPSTTQFPQQHSSLNNTINSTTRFPELPNTNPLFSFSPITFSPSPTPSTPSNRLSLPLYVEQQIHDTHQNSITHTNLLNHIIRILSGTGLEPGENANQQPQQPQQPRQFATLTAERILQLKNSANSPANFSVKLICEIFTPEELINHNVNGGPGRLGLNPVKLQEVKDIFFIFIQAMTRKRSGKHV